MLVLGAEATHPEAADEVPAAEAEQRVEGVVLEEHAAAGRTQHAVDLARGSGEVDVMQDPLAGHEVDRAVLDAGVLDRRRAHLELGALQKRSARARA